MDVKHVFMVGFIASVGLTVALFVAGEAYPEPFNFTPMGVNSISPGSPHVRPMGVHRTCGEPDEIKKNTHPENFTALFREQARPTPTTPPRRTRPS